MGREKMQESTAQESPYRICLHPLFNFCDHIWSTDSGSISPTYPSQQLTGTFSVCHCMPRAQPLTFDPRSLSILAVPSIKLPGAQRRDNRKRGPCIFCEWTIWLYGFHSSWWKLTGKLSPETLRRPSALPQLGALWNSCGSWVETMQVEG